MLKSEEENISVLTVKLLHLYMNAIGSAVHADAPNVMLKATPQSTGTV